MRIDLPGQFDLPIRAIPTIVPTPTGTKEELGIRIAQLLARYDSRPSSGLWIEIQACAREILK
ncbi:hypothetical protein [Pseudomonas typographi]|uniref:Uncharacterized protein n=1 Tax=Pseudomonas typographi TaxID=2715964 RepID=A0ABR7Z9M8_9PSED|nr:hypothetical protein [Pseudomonas typographi]MBD1554264.1 hypothetical protein [Pseudomonas typographi]MBD1602270.1 hypothetical protein [Pseudomonas typographi]